MTPCLFCGEAEKITIQGSGFSDATWWVQCHGCQARGPEAESASQAVANWNRRPASTIAYETNTGETLPSTGHHARLDWQHMKDGLPSVGEVLPDNVIAVESVAVDNSRAPVVEIPSDDLAKARECRDLAGLPSVSTTVDDGGVSMDFDLGGEPKKR